MSHECPMNMTHYVQTEEGADTHVQNSSLTLTCKQVQQVQVAINSLLASVTSQTAFLFLSVHFIVKCHMGLKPEKLGGDGFIFTNVAS